MSTKRVCDRPGCNREAGVEGSKLLAIQISNVDGAELWGCEEWDICPACAVPVQKLIDRIILYKPEPEKKPSKPRTKKAEHHAKAPADPLSITTATNDEPTATASNH
jgi:hypothetical protein